MVFHVEQPKTKQTTKRLGNAHFAGRAGGYAHFVGAGRAPPVFSTPSHQHDARRRRQRGVRGAKPSARYTPYMVFEVHTWVFEGHIRFSKTIYGFSTTTYEFSMSKNRDFERENDHQRSKIGFDHL